MSLPQQPQVSPRLAPGQVEALLIHLIRIEALLNEAMEHADQDVFNRPGEYVYDSVWRALTHYRREQGVMPTKTNLFAQSCAAVQGGLVYGGSFSPINARSAADPNVFRYNVELFLNMAFYVPYQDLDINYARTLLKRLLNERTVCDELTSILTTVNRNDVIVNLPDALARVSAQNLRVQAIGSSVGYGMLDHADGGHFMPRHPTGISYIDRATSPASTEVQSDASADLTGGWLPKETYLILGPQGGGKTQTSIMLTTEAADRYACGLPSDAPGTRRGAIYFHYEMPKEQISKRAIAYAAKIPTHRLLGRDYASRFSDANYPESWQPYELPWILEDQRLGRQIKAERQRFYEIRERMAHWTSFQMHGMQNGVAAGTGGVAEMSSIIERHISRTGIIPAIVVIDYAKVVVTRKLQFAGKDLDKGMRFELASFADQCNQMIGAKFNCGVFVMHQLTGKSNSMPPSRVPHHSAAGECAAMGEQFDFCFCYGMRDLTNNCMWFNASKTRDSEGLRGPVIVKMEGAFSRIAETDDYVSVNGNFRLRVDAGSVANVPRRPSPGTRVVEVV